MIRLLRGDCRVTLATLEAGSVQSVVTSPPYWGLRSYGTPDLVWGGDAEHAHEWGGLIAHASRGNRESFSGPGLNQSRLGVFYGGAEKPTSGAFCPCGAWLGSLGLEPTPELFVEHIVECFRAVRRVLRADGVLFCNMGDSYAGSGKGPQRQSGINGRGAIVLGQVPYGTPPPAGYKAKDLMEIPSMVAQALRADGWYLRSRIPWLKRNAMPESVTDRPATSVEYVFLLSKSGRYFWDADAVRVPLTAGSIRVSKFVHSQPNVDASRNDRETIANFAPANGRNRRNGDWFFESWQGLLMDEQDAPLALVVNPAPFSASRLEHAYGDGRHRTTSPDCPIHGVPTELADDRADGGLPDASHSARSPHNDGRPAQSPASELPATRTDLVASLVDLPTATARSKRTSKRDSRSGAPSGAGGAMFSDIEYSGVRPASPATYDRTPESSNDPGDLTAHPSEQTTDRTARMAALEQELESGANANGVCYSEANSTAGASDSDRATQSPPRNDRKCSCHIVDHYAVFPPKLVEPMVKASTSERGCCAECGAPWARVVERTELPRSTAPTSSRDFRLEQRRASGMQADPRTQSVPRDYASECTTTGWQPTCAHPGEPVPCTILDPFAGSGTTLMVADRLGRNAIGCELSESYSDMGTARVIGDAPMFVELGA